MSQRDRRERANSEREKTPAPAHILQDHEVFAVEHPMIIHNIDKALKTFGTNRPFRRVRFNTALLYIYLANQCTLLSLALFLSHARRS